MSRAIIDKLSRRQWEEQKAERIADLAKNLYDSLTQGGRDYFTKVEKLILEEFLEENAECFNLMDIDIIFKSVGAKVEAGGLNGGISATAIDKDSVQFNSFVMMQMIYRRQPQLIKEYCEAVEKKDFITPVIPSRFFYIHLFYINFNPGHEGKIPVGQPTLQNEKDSLLSIITSEDKSKTAALCMSLLKDLESAKVIAEMWEESKRAEVLTSILQASDFLTVETLHKIVTNANIRDPKLIFNLGKEVLKSEKALYRLLKMLEIPIFPEYQEILRPSFEIDLKKLQKNKKLKGSEYFQQYVSLIKSYQKDGLEFTPNFIKDEGMRMFEADLKGLPQNKKGSDKFADFTKLVKSYQDVGLEFPPDFIAQQGMEMFQANLKSLQEKKHDNNKAKFIEFVSLVRSYSAAGLQFSQQLIFDQGMKIFDNNLLQLMSDIKSIYPDFEGRKSFLFFVFANSLDEKDIDSTVDNDEDFIRKAKIINSVFSEKEMSYEELVGFFYEFKNLERLKTNNARVDDLAARFANHNNKQPEYLRIGNVFDARELELVLYYDFMEFSEEKIRQEIFFSDQKSQDFKTNLLAKIDFEKRAAFLNSVKERVEGESKENSGGDWAMSETSVASPAAPSESASLAPISAQQVANQNQQQDTGQNAGNDGSGGRVN